MLERAQGYESHSYSILNDGITLGVISDVLSMVFTIQLLLLGNYTIHSYKHTHLSKFVADFHVFLYK